MGPHNEFAAFNGYLVLYHYQQDVLVVEYAIRITPIQPEDSRELKTHVLSPLHQRCGDQNGATLKAQEAIQPCLAMNDPGSEAGKPNRI
jgi:hypothetical protein